MLAVGCYGEQESGNKIESMERWSRRAQQSRCRLPAAGCGKDGRNIIFAIGAEVQGLSCSLPDKGHGIEATLL